MVGGAQVVHLLVGRVVGALRYILGGNWRVSHTKCTSCESLHLALSTVRGTLSQQTSNDDHIDMARHILLLIHVLKLWIR